MLTTLFSPAILEKGRKEGKVDDAKNMLIEGLEIPLIVKITGLSKEEILKIKEELDGRKH